ncbi:MAG: hypothetical protein RLZZ54_179 [Cyanobacteriota bacterium]|jgi:hypothetical protein
MTHSTKTTTIPAVDASACLGRTCLKWRADGELTELDLSLVLARLALVDQQLSDPAPQHSA